MRTFRPLLTFLLAAVIAASPILASTADAGARHFFTKWAARGVEAEIAEGIIVHEERALVEGFAARLANAETRAATVEEMEAFAVKHPKLTARIGSMLRPYAGDAAENQGLYRVRKIESLIDEATPSGKSFTSKTLPKATDKNVKLANIGQDVEIPNAPGEAQITGEATKKVHVPYDERGFANFDKFSKFDYKIADYDATADEATHMREATRALRTAIKDGQISKSKFTDAQLKAIKSGKAKIPDYTWHHHQDTGRMQLVPTEIHKQAGHIGGYAINQ
jgi:hypothetical protein